MTNAYPDDCEGFVQVLEPTRLLGAIWMPSFGRYQPSTKRNHMTVSA